MSNAPVVFPILGPLAGVADGYANELARLGYAPVSVRLQVKLFADLSEWLPKQGLAAANLTSSDLSRFLDDRRSAGHSRYASSKAVRPILDYLQRLGVVAKQIDDEAPGQVEEMLGRFWRYLTIERALAPVTARAYLDLVRPFVRSRMGADNSALGFESLSAADVIAFVTAHCPRLGRGAAKLTVTALRSFLGFLHLEGVIAESLSSAVPSVAGRRLVGLPKGLAPDQVQCLLTSCDRHTRRGCRDLAILTIAFRQ